MEGKGRVSSSWWVWKGTLIFVLCSDINCLSRFLHTRRIVYRTISQSISAWHDISNLHLFTLHITLNPINPYTVESSKNMLNLALHSDLFSPLKQISKVSLRCLTDSLDKEDQKVLHSSPYSMWSENTIIVSYRIYFFCISTE